MNLSYELVKTTAKRMVEAESRGNGDQINAIERVAKQCGVSSRSLRRLIAGEPKDISITTAINVLRAEAEQLTRMIARMEAELAIARAQSPHIPFDDLGAELKALSVKLEERKKRISG